MAHFKFRRLFSLVVLCLLGLVQLGSSAPGVRGQNPTQQTQKPQSSAAQSDDQFDESFNRARALALHGEYKDAITEFQRAAALKQGDCGDCFRAIGEAFIHLKKYKDAAGAFHQALGLKPDNPAELYNSMGVALYFDGEKDKASLNEAVDAFKKALELSNNTLEQAYFNLGSALLRLGKTDEGVEALKTYLKIAPHGPDARQAQMDIDNPKSTTQAASKGSSSKSGESKARESRAGGAAPDFNVKSITGEDLSLVKFRGKIVLLDFWATWCGPCRQEMPNVKRVWEKYRNDNFVIIGISLDKDRRSLDQYLQSEDITWPQYYERGGRFSVAGQYGVNAIPQSFLIDQDGAVKGVGLRGGALYDKVGDLLKKLRKTEAKGL